MNRTELRRELDALLSEDVAQAEARARHTYDELAGSAADRIVLFGAGILGRKTLAGLRRLGIEPLGFCDSNPASQGRSIEGVEVFSPAAAAARFGADAVFLITVWGGRSVDTMPQRVEQLRALGCRKVIPFGYLFWKHPAVFLPHYPMDLPAGVLAARDEVARAFDQWEDDASRIEYLAQIKWRLNLDFGAMPRPVAHEIYFPDDLVRVRPDEVFVDCGAFDGDTLAAFLRRQGNAFGKALSFEPDPRNYAQLAAFREGLDPILRERVQVFPNAVSDRTGKVRFDPTGTEASVMGVGELELDCVALDELPAAADASWIKMDIEGAEPLALAGARGVIARNAPVLAVCVYHQQAHVWEIPRLVAGMSEAHASYLRPHLLEGWDLVYYGIPRSRLA